VLIDVAGEFGISEPDPEIQELLCRSRGINIGLRYLDGAFNFALAAAGDLVAADFAARLVWLDAYVTNPDRSHRNPNLLIHERRPWLIDHGAALYVHHDWPSATTSRARAAFPMIRDHVLLTNASDIEDVDDACAAAMAATLDDVLAGLPDALLLDPVGGDGFTSGDEARGRYSEWLRARVDAPRAFAADAAVQQRQRRAEPPRALKARR
jgi:hypothetical protein